VLQAALEALPIATLVAAQDGLILAQNDLRVTHLGDVRMIEPPQTFPRHSVPGKEHDRVASFCCGAIDCRRRVPGECGIRRPGQRQWCLSFPR
jgi:hypothetical protein